MLASLLLAGCSLPPGQRVVARINGEKIYSGDLQKELEKETGTLSLQIMVHPDGPETWKRKVLDALIEKRILLQTARKQALRIDAADLRRGQEKIGTSGEEFGNLLREKGISERQWEENQRTRLLIQKLVQSVLEPHRPSEPQLQESYRKGTFREPERSHCRQIVTTSREKAEKILSLLKSGENFAALAQKHSESPDRERGGDLGWVGRGELPPIMDEACFRFPHGQTTEIVASSYGFHIFRVLERRPAHRLTFSEAKPLIEAEWRDTHQEKILRDWLEQKAREFQIEVDEVALRDTPLPEL